MLEIMVKGELFDEKLEKFIPVNPTILHLEHSLLSISKWESKFHKAFLSNRPKTQEEMFYYIKCMTINKNVKDDVYLAMSEKNYKEIYDYMNNSMTAAWFWDDDVKGKNSSKATPSEVIYCRMIRFGIPFECEKWHINRLISLIRTFNVEYGDGGKLTKEEIIKRNRALNEKRKKELNTRG